MADEGEGSLERSVVELEERVLPQVVELVHLGLRKHLVFDVHGLLECDVKSGLSTGLLQTCDFGDGLSHLFFLQPPDGVVQELQLGAHLSAPGVQQFFLAHFDPFGDGIFLVRKAVDKPFLLLLVGNPRLELLEEGGGAAVVGLELLLKLSNLFFNFVVVLIDAGQELEQGVFFAPQGVVMAPKVGDRLESVPHCV